MVIETANSAGAITVGTTSVPSIEFVVPSANQLLSSYVPTYSVATTNYPQAGGDIIGYNPGVSTPVEDTVTTATVARSKQCNNFPTIRGAGLSNAGWYVFRFASLSGVPPVGQIFYVSGMGKNSPSYYYDFLKYKAESHTSNNNVVATAVLNGEGSWSSPYPNQSKATRDRWRAQNGAPFSDLESTTKAPTLSWEEITTTVTKNPPTVGPRQPIYSAIIPAYSIINVTVSIPASIVLENNTSISGKRVVEMPVFFYIENGIFKDFNNNVMSGLPPTITSIPSAIPRSAVNTNPKDVTSSQISLRSYRFSIAKYTFENGLWSGVWSQFDDAYISEPLMRNVIYSGQAIL